MSYIQLSLRDIIISCKYLDYRKSIQTVLTKIFREILTPTPNTNREYHVLIDDLSNSYTLECS